jgi:hypothetical protein
LTIELPKVVAALTGPAMTRSSKDDGMDGDNNTNSNNSNNNNKNNNHNNNNNNHNNNNWLVLWNAWRSLVCCREQRELCIDAL